MLLTSAALIPGNGHDLRGSMTFHATNHGVRFMTSDDFYFDGSPDPSFTLSPNGSFDTTTAVTHQFRTLPGSGAAIGPQIEITGRQTSEMPQGFDVKMFHSVFLWCFQFPFLLGQGRLTVVDQ